MSGRLWGCWSTLDHRAGCTGAWSVLVDQPIFSDEHPRALVVLCWACGERVDFTAYTPATDDPGVIDLDDRRDIPHAHRPTLAVSTGGINDLAVTVPPDRVAGHLVHIEAWLGPHEPGSAYLWLVATRDGDVLGRVSAYRTARYAERFRWDTYGDPDDPATFGEGFKTRDAAAKALIRATRPTAGST